METKGDTKEETKESGYVPEVRIGIVARDSGDLSAVTAIFEPCAQKYSAKFGNTDQYTSRKGPQSDIIVTSPPSGCKDETTVTVTAQNVISSFPKVGTVVYLGKVVVADDSGIEDGDVIVVDGVDGLVGHSIGKGGELAVARKMYTRPNKMILSAIAKMKGMTDIRKKLREGALEVTKRMHATSRKQFESTAKEMVELGEVKTAQDGSKTWQTGATQRDEPTVHYGTVSCGSLLEKMVLSDESKEEFKVLGFSQDLYGLVTACMDGNCVFILGASTVKGSTYGQATSAVFAKIFVDNLDLTQSAPIQRTKLALPDGLDAKEIKFAIAVESYRALIAISQMFGRWKGNPGPKNPMFFANFDYNGSNPEFKGVKIVIVSPPESDDTHDPVQDIEALFPHINYCARITTGGAVPKSEGAKQDVTPGTCVFGQSFTVYDHDKFIATGRPHAMSAPGDKGVCGIFGTMDEKATRHGDGWQFYLRVCKVTIPASCKYESSDQVLERGDLKLKVVSGNIVYGREFVTEAKVRQGLQDALGQGGDHLDCISKSRHVSTSADKLKFILLCAITNSCDATSVKVADEYYNSAIFLCGAFLADMLCQNRLAL